MPAESANHNRDFWLTKARNTGRRINLGWWLETLAGPLVIVSIVAAVAALWLRREIPQIPHWQLASGCASALLLTGIACLLVARRRFESQSDAMVRIEASMGMRNALSAASAGIAPWPAPRQQINAGIRWHAPRLLVPLIGALTLLTAGLWFPVSARQPTAAHNPEQPQAWQQIEAELDMLANQQVADETYLEETRKRLDELKSQQEEQWFSHSSLEATDTLRESHNAETRRIEREAERANNALTTLEKNAASITPAERNRLLNQFDQALEGMKNGAMKPNPELLKQMQDMDLKNLADLTPEQIEQLRQNLQKHADAMGQCNGGQGQGEADWTDELLADENDAPGQDGDGPGQGGVNRGPGHAPGVLGNQKDKLETGKLEGLAAQDLSRTAPGDLLELQNGEHDIDTSATTLTTGGNITSTGQGGDRVWRDSLDPDEQRVMKRFFE